MSILQVKNIHKSFGGHSVLAGADLRVEEKERVALIGPNGAGKSTLLKIITGQIAADEGELFRAKNARIGYLAQDSGLDSDKDMWTEVLTAFHGLKQQELRLRQLEAEMGKESVLADEERYQKILEDYSRLQAAFEESGGYEYEARARSALNGLGLGSLNWEHTPVRTLSGGQKTRLALAKLLLETPDLIILDEPTNYLDMDALAWLEHMLANYDGAVLVVSHDRFFLDRIVNVVYEMDRAKTIRYKGNYSDYVQQREERIALWEKEYEKQQTEIRKMEEFVQRNIARASTTKRAQSRRKALEKMDRLEKPPSEQKQAAIRFEPAVTSGKEVVITEDLSVGYDPGQPLIRSLSIQIHRGDRIALLGPNGTGKSTLLKTLLHRLPAISGTIRFGTHVEADYYDQEQEELTPSHTVLEEVWSAHPKLDQTTIRSYLGQFLFHGDEVYKQVADLSGGEKARLSLVKRLLKRANLLVMDEPTNHLDMDSKERLEEALESFTGTLLFVSHDRYFINRLANRIWVLDNGTIYDFNGTYTEYLEKMQNSEPEKAASESDTSSADYEEQVRKERQRQREERRRKEEAARLEKEIADLEKESAAIQEELCRPEVYSNPEQSVPLQQRLGEIEHILAEKTERWLELEEENS
ncbi:multidrug ABC transporter ATP-binding protein [Marinithermofilum abyssi]|uniref:Multidrug ABC transporter ATP-binding protein n=1 Tax=Marinithermofilum abyssi TaxID=1571185 RepID=A0A8J2VD89_9BACL|nr:ABC-F type ribosomal protection protein [Marinithermofilum abyssi]GGE24166.1 multidrug ABC transporter ATP-binding protein [Marinithermofilum abyssi]